MSYGLTVELLGEVLPLSKLISVSSLHRQVQRVGERMDGELGEEQMFFIEGCPLEWAELPRPEMPLVVGLDGGYVHSCERKARKDSCFEVIVGKSVTTNGSSKCFGFVNCYDTKPKRRLFEVLKSQGMQMNQQVTFLSDGGDTVRELQLYLNPEAEHLLDWFHITMRLTVMQQMAKGLGPEGSESRTSALKELESIKWYLWHGNVFQALQHINFLEMDLDGEVKTGERAKKLLRTAGEFYTYIENNQRWIPNYGDRYRHGEMISTGFVESTVNQVIAKRMVKKQQMRWTKRGAHLLLQVRTRVLNEEFRGTFSGWYPGMRVTSGAEGQEELAA